MEWEEADAATVAAASIDAAAAYRRWVAERSGGGAPPRSVHLRLELTFGPRAPSEVSQAADAAPRSARRLVDSRHGGTSDVTGGADAPGGEAGLTGQGARGAAESSATSALACGATRPGLVAVRVTDVMASP